MRLIITEKQLKKIKEDSESSETLTTLTNLSDTADEFQDDLGGKYLRRYRKNDKNSVKRIQTMLTLLGYDVGHYGDGEPAIDGLYGPDTAEAVRHFQKDKFYEPIEWDSIVGPKTYTKLYRDIEELGNEHLMSVEEVLLLGLDDDEISDEVSKLGREVVDKASERLCEPYKWGGTFDGVGGDCSGLVDWTFRHVDGVDSPGRDTTSTLKREEGFRSGKNNYDEVKPGDILLFDGKDVRHTGIVSDVNGDTISMIHSAGTGWDPGTKRGVQITKDTFNGYKYFKKNYMGYVPLEYFMVDKDEMMS